MIVVTERGIAQSISTLALLARHLDNAEPLMHQIGAMLRKTPTGSRGSRLSRQPSCARGTTKSSWTAAA